jgi:putative thioredoxin
MSQEFVIEVNESNFEFEVIEYSNNVPVLVDFWAEWCRPCKILSPMLEKLTAEGRGTFRLARVDVDFNKSLSIRYGVRTIPTVKAFLKGQVVAEFSGIQPESTLREFVHNLAPSPADLIVEKGMELLREHNWKQAEDVFKEVLITDENNSKGMLGLLTSYIGLGKFLEANRVLRSFPASHEFSSAENLKPLVEAYEMVDYIEITGDDELEAAFWNNIRLARRGNIPAALDGLLDILRKNKRYKKGQARLIVVALLQILGDEDPDSRLYRSELATILF